MQVIVSAPEQFTVIPHRHLLAKRLAQCLNPSLPGGVHLKAIEVRVHGQLESFLWPRRKCELCVATQVYALVFQRLGPLQLREDLYLYTVGLYPLFNTAFINVKGASHARRGEAPGPAPARGTQY
jgi:hypothetical protein